MSKGIISHRQFVATIGSVSFLLSFAAFFFYYLAIRDSMFPWRTLGNSVVFPIFLIAIFLLILFRSSKSSAVIYFVVVICSAAYIDANWGVGITDVSHEAETAFEQRTYAADAFYAASVAAALAAFPSVYILGFKGDKA